MNTASTPFSITMEIVTNCPTRNTVEELGTWLNSLEIRLEVDDPCYDQQTEELSRTLRRVREAAISSPPGCEITTENDDCYECIRCGLAIDIEA